MWSACVLQTWTRPHAFNPRFGNKRAFPLDLRVGHFFIYKQDQQASTSPFWEAPPPNTHQQLNFPWSIFVFGWVGGGMTGSRVKHVFRPKTKARKTQGSSCGPSTCPEQLCGQTSEDDLVFSRSVFLVNGSPASIWLRICFTLPCWF